MAPTLAKDGASLCGSDSARGAMRMRWSLSQPGTSRSSAACEPSRRVGDTVGDTQQAQHSWRNTVGATQLAQHSWSTVGIRRKPLVPSAISNQQSAISNQQSAISNQQSVGIRRKPLVPSGVRRALQRRSRRSQASQTQSDAIRRNQTQSDAARSSQKQSEAARSSQKQSEAVSRAPGRARAGRRQARPRAARRGASASPCSPRTRADYPRRVACPLESDRGRPRRR